MNEQLTLLIQLQEIDGRIRAAQEEKKRIPVQLAALEQRIAESKAGLDRVRERLETAQKAKRDRDRDLEAGGQKVEKLKARTSEIKTNKEYTALLKEIETVEQENKAIEDDILKLMENIDAAGAEIRAAEQQSAAEAASIAEERSSLEESAARVDRALAAEEGARSELARGVQEPVLARYQRLAGPLCGRVVVEARNESCSGCFMSIPPQLFVNVKKNEAINSCPHCRRILFFKDAIEPKVP